MGRFTKPRTKLCRRLGLQIFENANVEKAFLKRDTVQFGRRKLSEYGIRLTEKQKVMQYYGMREKQMRKLFDKARRMKGNTGKNFLILCEQRLDNVLCISGLTISRAQARQIIAHGNILVNGKKVDIPSYTVQVNDEITLRDKSGVKKIVKEATDRRSGHSAPEWLVSVPQAQSIKVVRAPEREDVTLPVNEQLVVEFYSR